MIHFAGVGAWQYIEQHRHAYFDKMQVISTPDVLTTLLLIINIFATSASYYLYDYLLSC